MRSASRPGAGSWIDAEVDGGPLGVDDALALALSGDGHYTSAQVRGGGIRGLAHHLARLTSAHAELYGGPLDIDVVRGLVRRVVRRRPDCSLRVQIVELVPEVPRVLVVARPPAEPPASPVRLATYAYVRPLAHLKHAGTFGQHVYGRRAERHGFDDALFVTPTGHITETSVANVALVRDGSLVWPAGASLRGITWQVLDDALAAAGEPASEAAVHREDVASFDGALVCNSVGIAAVRSVDDDELPGSASAVAAFVARYDAVPFDAV
jgi:branched-subunit amino acid aminotransferase/4-amino-4-deoxychorismate lyase